ncbi:hypothetical protein A2Z10_03640 [Candidatus Azambacteria bacterium RBG_16_47_10]|uniref:Uncharacterized protein n=1 Tax=Candidatus Azambacteria bacterium RBG_16_47_10 TaxID=1797292 RepID=A0A1F5B032_9BACT|nr:MAG: hypothetical protein A2Z10_03640 [Candidatus Azambacteria bacterium RBG_16_47_10]
MIAVKAVIPAAMPAIQVRATARTAVAPTRADVGAEESSAMNKNKGTRLRATEARKKDTHDVMSGRVGEYSVVLIKSINGPENAKFLVREVSVGGKVVWHFKDEHFTGLALLAELKGTPCICLVTSKKEVKKVIPIDTLRERKEEEHRMQELMELAKEKIKNLLK